MLQVFSGHAEGLLWANTRNSVYAKNSLVSFSKAFVALGASPTCLFHIQNPESVLNLHKEPYPPLLFSCLWHSLRDNPILVMWRWGRGPTVVKAVTDLPSPNLGLLCVNNTGLPSLALSSPCLLNESLTSEYERPPSWPYIKFCSSTKETAYLSLYPISVEMQVVLTPGRLPVAKQYESGKLTIRLITEHCGALHWLATGIQVYGTLPHSDHQGSITLPHSMPSLIIV